MRGAAPFCVSSPSVWSTRGWEGSSNCLPALCNCNLACTPGSAFPLRRSARVQQQWASSGRSALVSRWPPGEQEGLVCRLTIQGGDAIGLEAACELEPSQLAPSGSNTANKLSQRARGFINGAGNRSKVEHAKMLHQESLCGAVVMLERSGTSRVGECQKTRRILHICVGVDTSGAALLHPPALIRTSIYMPLPTRLRAASAIWTARRQAVQQPVRWTP